MPKTDNIEGFECGDPSDGDTTCDTYCGANSHTIRKGAVVFWKLSNVECGEYRAVCRRHALEEANATY